MALATKDILYLNVGDRADDATLTPNVLLHIHCGIGYDVTALPQPPPRTADPSTEPTHQGNRQSLVGRVL